MDTGMLDQPTAQQDMSEAQIMVARQEERRTHVMCMLEVEHSMAEQDVKALEEALRLANARLRVLSASMDEAQQTMPEPPRS